MSMIVLNSEWQRPMQVNFNIYAHTWTIIQSQQLCVKDHAPRSHWKGGSQNILYHLCRIPLQKGVGICHAVVVIKPHTWACWTIWSALVDWCEARNTWWRTLPGSVGDDTSKCRPLPAWAKPETGQVFWVHCYFEPSTPESNLSPGAVQNPKVWKKSQKRKPGDAEHVHWVGTIFSSSLHFIQNVKWACPQLGKSAIARQIAISSVELKNIELLHQLRHIYHENKAS